MCKVAIFLKKVWSIVIIYTIIMVRGRKGSSRKAAKCCACNGPYARCKSCACVKAGRSCSSCHPLRLDRCSNSHSNLSAPCLTMSCSQPLVLSNIAVECESQCFSQPTPPFQQSPQPPPQPLPPKPPPAVPPPAPDCFILHLSKSSAALIRATTPNK